MQPYFLPYLGYFALLKHTDLFILFDTPQYIRHGWIERNRILSLKGEPIYIKVPLVKHKRDAVINHILINNSLQWKQKIYAQLQHYKKKAPYYNNTILLLDRIFEDEYYDITSLNAKALTIISEYLEISTPIKIWSKMDVEIEAANHPDEWALNICKAIDAKTYYNPIGGKDFFNKEKYTNDNVVLKFLEIEPISYKQFSNEFEPFLSIIDVLMFVDKKSIMEMLTQIKLID
ncbi:MULTISPECIES: WbqC family protein [Winogradskyella]|uniref:WbqC-like protein family protein n=1 Tax=Winogradskyella thalassocola TaxID=262004 RepID=A0A1G8FX36_9FLAO|nr:MULTISPECIES: WbqC family protein [Winogradskyella]SDH86703.1 WbqC-like protein family protein [Winogradskyella thalassocola]